MKKYKTDYERLETVKAFKVSKLTVSEFARRNHMPRETLRGWINAFDNIDGSFVNLSKVVHSNELSMILENDDIRVKMLDTQSIYKKSHHFSRFDHSIVVIEFEHIKVTTSLEQAIAIIGKYYDRFK